MIALSGFKALYIRFLHHLLFLWNPSSWFIHIAIQFFHRLVSTSLNLIHIKIVIHVIKMKVASYFLVYSEQPRFNITVMVMRNVVDGEHRSVFFRMSSFGPKWWILLLVMVNKIQSLNRRKIFSTSNGSEDYLKWSSTYRIFRRQT